MTDGPESTAERVALWRALHVELDAAPHVLTDRVGLELANPAPGWRDRPDMDPDATRGYRASIVARARFVEDFVVEQGTGQYVILGAGLDTFAQRRPEVDVRVFEVDQPAPQAWKRRRLDELGYGAPDRLRFVPVDFEVDDDWPARLATAGFEPDRPAVVVSTGVSMYLSREATARTLKQVAACAPGSAVVMSFIPPPELLDDADRAGHLATEQAAARAGTPFVSHYQPEEIALLARDAGLTDVRHVSSRALADRYFTGRPDGLRPPTGEDLLVALAAAARQTPRR